MVLEYSDGRLEQLLNDNPQLRKQLGFMEEYDPQTGVPLPSDAASPDGKEASGLLQRAMLSAWT